MRRSILLMLVYAGTISLWGILPVCLFVPGEIWLQPFVKGSFMLILAGFLIRKNLSGFTGKEPQGIGYYLYGAGYWGDGDPEDIYCGLNRRAFWYLVHWQLMMLLCLILGNWMREMPSSAADPLRFIFFHNLLTPLYGILWRSCFRQYTVGTDFSELPYLRIPPLFCDLLFHWLFVAAAVFFMFEKQ